jgi:hypothetical protein
MAQSDISLGAQADQQEVPTYTVDDLNPKDGETQEDYTQRIKQIPPDKQKDLFKEKWPDSDLLPQSDEDQETYQNRLATTVPKVRLLDFKQGVAEAQRQQQMWPQLGEDQDSYQERLKENYSPEELQKFKQQAQVVQQQQDIEQQKELYGKELELAPENATKFAAAAVAGAKFFTWGLSEVGLASAGATLDWFNSLPDQTKGSWADLYNQNLNSVQAYREALYEKHPFWYGGGAVVGTVRSVGVVGKVAKGLNVVQQTAVDATMFGVMGANEGQERFSNGQWVEVAENAGKAGIEGSVGGLVLRGATAAIVAGGKKVSPQVAAFLVSKLDKIGFNVESYVAEDLETNAAEESLMKNQVLSKLPDDWKEWAASVPAEEKSVFLNKVPYEAKEKVNDLIGTKFSDPSEMNDWLAWNQLQKEQTAFSTYYSSISKVEPILESGDPLVSKGYDLWRKSVYAGPAMEEATHGLVGLNSYVAIRQFFRNLANSSSVGAAIDLKWGTKVGYLADAGARADNLYKVTAMAVVEDANTLETIAKKVPSLLEDVKYTDVFTKPDGTILTREVTAPKLYAATRSNEVYGSLSQAEKDVVDYGKDLTDNAAQLSDLAGQPIQRQPNFVADKVKKPIDLIPAIKEEVDRIGTQYGTDLHALTDDTYQNLSEGSKSFAELKSVLGRFSGVEIEDARTFDQAYQQMMIPNTRTMKNMVTASTLLEKEGTMPWFIKELDVPTTIRDWALNTYKAAYVNPVLQELNAVAKMLEGKDDVAAAYINRLTGDITGTGSSVARDVSQFMDRQDLILKSPEATLSQKSLAVTAKAVGGLVDFVGKQIYPVTMGFNPKVVVRHVVQPYTMMASDLTGVGKSALENPFFGTRMTTKGGINVGLLKEFGWNGQKGVAALAAKLKSIGEYPPKELFEALEESMGKKGVATSVLDGANWVSMAPVETSFILGRATAVETGSLVGDEIVGGLNATKAGQALTKDQASALSYLREMQPGYRVKFQENIRNWYKATEPAAKEAAEEEMRKDTIHYLVAKHFFHYNRATMSQFGREYGWVANMFTKWPSSIASDLLLKHKDFGLSGGALRALKQYYAPLLASHVVDTLILSDQLKDKSSAARMALGAGGVSTLVPGQVILDLASRGYRPPIVDAATEGYSALKDLTTGDPKFAKEFDKLYNTIGPFAQYFNAYQKIMSATTGEQPETISQFFSKLGE